MPEFDEYLKNLRAKLALSAGRADEICAEVRSHLEASFLQARAAGHNPQEASRRAVKDFGEAEKLAQSLAEANRRHRAALIWRGAVLGAFAGLLVYLAASWAGSHMTQTSFADFARPEYLVSLGIIPGVLWGCFIARFRLRARFVLALGGVALALAGLARGAAYYNYWFGAMEPLQNACGVILLDVAIGLAAALWIHEWMLGPRAVLADKFSEGAKRASADLETE